MKAKEDQERQEREDERKLREEERKHKIDEDRKVKHDDRKRLREDINRNVSAVLETTGKAQKVAANRAKVEQQSPRRTGKTSPTTSPQKSGKKTASGKQPPQAVPAEAPVIPERPISGEALSENDEDQTIPANVYEQQ